MSAEDSVVIIFTSTRTTEAAADYAEWATELDTLVHTIDGYQSHDSFRDPVTRQGVTIAYFDDEDAVIAWRNNARHRQAQSLGRSSFYESYEVVIANVTARHGWQRP